MIVQLQILRGVAALLVVFAHALDLALQSGTPPATPHDLPAHLGNLGVCLFFVISGFIMVHTSSRSFGTPGASARFAIRRVLRIVPLYYVATLLEAAWRTGTGRPPEWTDVLCSLLFVPLQVETADGTTIRHPVVFVGWTLNYEMFFYAIFALCLAFRRPAGLLALFALLIGIVAAGSWLKPLADTGAPSSALTFWSAPIISLFAAGAVIGVLMQAFPGLRGSLGPLGFTAACLPSAGALAWLFATSGFPLPLGERSAYWSLCILVVASTVVLRPPANRRAIAPAAWIGDASYSIYLFHFFAILAAGKLLSAAAPDLPAGACVGLAMLAGVAVGCAVHVAIEIPLTAWIRRPFERRAATSVLGQAARFD